MIADATGVMPDALKFDADQRFYERGLDRVDVVVHGRNSHERQPHSHLRRRLIVTGQVPSLAADPSNERALFWNPAGASFAQALARLGAPNERVGVIGGTDVFALFLDLYDLFQLSRAPGVLLPGGRPVFPHVPPQTPQAILADHGLARGRRRLLDRSSGLTIETWRRRSPASAARESTRGGKTSKPGR
jgi:dihydrofolate reductase